MVKTTLGFKIMILRQMKHRYPAMLLSEELIKDYFTVEGFQKFCEGYEIKAKYLGYDGHLNWLIQPQVDE